MLIITNHFIFVDEQYLFNTLILPDQMLKRPKIQNSLRLTGHMTTSRLKFKSFRIRLNQSLIPYLKALMVYFWGFITVFMFNCSSFLYAYKYKNRFHSKCMQELFLLMDRYVFIMFWFVFIYPTLSVFPHY